MRFTEGLAGPAELSAAWVTVQHGDLASAGLEFEPLVGARVSVTFDLDTADVDVASDHALFGSVEVDARFEHLTGSPENVRTEWVQPVRFSWQFDPFTRAVQTTLEGAAPALGDAAG